MSRSLKPLLTALLVFIAGSVVANDEMFPQGFVGTLAASPSTAIVGELVEISGTGFEPGAELDLVWMSYDLAWDLGEVDGEYDGTFRGLEKTPREELLTSVAADADGNFTTSLTVPEDFGGVHNILVRDDGTNLNQAGVEVRADLQISPQEGVLGSDITITVTGLNVGHPMVWYQLSYDHHITGFLSAVYNRGTAETVIPATGRPGPHLIRIEDSPFGQPYLALDTSPYAFLEVPSQTFTILEGEPQLPEPVANQVLPSLPDMEPMGVGPSLWADPWTAAVGVEANLEGVNFEPGSTLRLELSGMVGSRVTESGFTPVSHEFAEVEVGADGSFTLPYTFPDTHGGFHSIKVFNGSDTSELTRARIRVLPIAYELETQEVRYGDVLNLHFKGIGWTQTENIFGVVVDNTYIGYACGFSTNGDVQFPLEVSWEPGWHFIDIYPSFYRNKEYSAVDEAPFLFRHALLTWEDHPSGFHFRYAFHVLPEE